MEQNSARMVCLLQNELFAKPLDKAQFDGMSAGEWQELFALADHHDIAHLLGDAITREELTPDPAAKQKFEETFCEAVLRAQLTEAELERICSLLGNSRISYLPLKGAVIRGLYPEPWMRTSCDIDILIHREDVKKAKELLMGKCGYRLTKTPVYHEVSLYSPSGVHLELHFSIEEHTEQLDVVLRRSWDHAVPTGTRPYEYRFQNEFLLFYSIAHAAYHFKGGGCGVRPAIDQFLMEQKLEFDSAKLDALLAEANLTVFAERFHKLCRYWFAEGEGDELICRMERYILTGGVYGTVKSRETVRLIQRGRFGNFMRRVWLPYADLITKYPSLEGKRILQPLYEVRRWFTLFKGRIFKRVVHETKTSLNVDPKQKEQTKKLLVDLDLL